MSFRNPVTTLPASAITGSLPATQVSTGNFTGTYNIVGAFTTGGTGARVDINPTGIYAYNTSGGQTVKVSAADGSIAISGTFTIATAGSGTRVVMDNAGVRGYAGTTNTFNLDAATGNFTLQTAASGTRMVIDNTGINAFNGATNTFKLASTTGAVTITGTFTIQSATSGARVSLDSTNGFNTYDGSNNNTLNIDTSGNITAISSVVVADTLAAAKRSIQLTWTIALSNMVTGSDQPINGAALIYNSVGSGTLPNNKAVLTFQSPFNNTGYTFSTNMELQPGTANYLGGLEVYGYAKAHGQMVVLPIQGVVSGTAVLGSVTAVATKLTANTAAITTVTQIMSTAIVSDGVKTLLVNMNLNGYIFSVATDRFVYTLKADGVQIGSGFLQATSGAQMPGFSYTVPHTPAVGNHTYTAEITRNAGTGTCTIISTATAPSSLNVHQLV
jgi:hypothetical protein